jgi:hypothetical protein
VKHDLYWCLVTAKSALKALGSKLVRSNAACVKHKILDLESCDARLDGNITWQVSFYTRPRDDGLLQAVCEGEYANKTDFGALWRWVRAVILFCYSRRRTWCIYVQRSTRKASYPSHLGGKVLNLSYSLDMQFDWKRLENIKCCFPPCVQTSYIESITWLVLLHGVFNMYTCTMSLISLYTYSFTYNYVWHTWSVDLVGNYCT